MYNFYYKKDMAFKYSVLFITQHWFVCKFEEPYYKTPVKLIVNISEEPSYNQGITYKTTIKLTNPSQTHEYTKFVGFFASTHLIVKFFEVAFYPNEVCHSKEAKAILYNKETLGNLTEGLKNVFIKTFGI